MLESDWVIEEKKYFFKIWVDHNLQNAWTPHGPFSGKQSSSGSFFYISLVIGLWNADFNIPRFRTVHYGKHSLRYFGPHLWNKLEQSERENPNFNSFENSIKTKDLSLLIDNCKNITVVYAARPP